MPENFLIQLTKNLYRLTLLFPKKEPLRYKMRELANNILAKSLTPNIKHNSPVLDDIKVLDSFFEVARAQNWVRPDEILKLQQEYSKLREGRADQTPKQKIVGSEGISGRQKKILEFLEKQGKGQVADLKKIFSQVSKRTLRRDFEDLLKKGKVVRAGEWNQVFYRLNSDRTEHLS